MATPDAERRETVPAGRQIIVSDWFMGEPGALVFDQWLVGFSEEVRRVYVVLRCIISICVDRIKPAGYNEIVIKAAVNGDFITSTAG